ncbi:MAG: efflux RND transporter permease subunit [Myxococcales bacterium]
MNPAAFALKRPIAMVVLAIGLALGAAIALRSAPVDIFPHLGIPVIYVVQPYAGMAPSQMEGQLVTYYEYHYLYVNGVQRIESQSIQGLALIKIYFHPGTDIASALAQVTAMSFRAIAFMPPGTLPPFILRFGAGSIPVGQLVFSSDSRSGTSIQDLAIYRVRPLLATLPGVSAPPPSGGRVREIVVDVDADRMRSYRISPEEVAQAVAKGNLTVPSGNVNIGAVSPLVATNAMVSRVDELLRLPLKTGAGPTIFLGDIGSVRDAADIVYNVALVNGRHTVYMSLTKEADASTLAVVAAIKAALPRMRELVPKDVHISFEFDQSVYVRGAIVSLAVEAAMGAVLTGLMVLLFLHDLPAVVIVVSIIPLSLMGSLVGLRLAGQTLNIMTLGGLALSIGVLVDEATVSIENIHAHLQRGEKPRLATMLGSGEVALPNLVSMLCVNAVFLPAFSMTGIGRALFPPLALAVAFSMATSYVVARTLLPVLAAFAFRHRTQAPKEGRLFERLKGRYRRAVEGGLRHPWIPFTVYGVALVGAGVVAVNLGTALFPRASAGQLQLRVRAPTGTRLERTEAIVDGVEDEIKKVVGPELVAITLANIGPPPWEYPVNATFVWNSGPQEALVLASLRSGHRPSVPAIEELLRPRLARRFPGVRFSFEAGDIVSQVLDFGSPAPIAVTVAGNDLDETRRFSERLLARLKQIPALRDVQIPQPLDYPTVDVRIDRERAGQLGVTVAEVTRSIVAATSSSVLVVPNFWTDPATGLPYRVAVRVPQHQLTSETALGNLPVVHQGELRPYLSDVASLAPSRTPGEYDHLDGQRTITLTANLGGSDLGRAGEEVDRAIREVGKPPRGSTVSVRGQVSVMKRTLSSLRSGLLLAILIVLLLLALNFQSFRTALVVVSSVPAVIAGVFFALVLTGTTLNVESMMGAIMAIGIAVANAVLLVTFANVERRKGSSGHDSALEGATARLRPILMTSLAMIAGMVPMSLGLSEGGKLTAPLGRAVIGGLTASVFATLLVLPAVYALAMRKATGIPASLHPDDEAVEAGKA